MEKVRALAEEYGPYDTFNMDGTALFWKLNPDRTLATKAGSSEKKLKDRIPPAFTVHGDGSDKLLTWVIGKSKNPRCFKYINRHLLRIQYRWNKTKWMIGLIMEECLQWLENKMKGENRKILLLLDNFSGHELSIELVSGKEGLSYVRIEWLPPNATSY